MSRCFPFPPPGYEKKDRPVDDANILIKEKHKEKKHKKDKKDKEKKEKKEKKDKEKSGEKNGEKKDRKRKHKDKDKSKEKEEKKDSEGKKIVISSSHRNGEKRGPVGIQVVQTHQQGRLELEKGVGKWNGPNEIQNLDDISSKEFSIKSSGKELESNHGIFVEGNQKFKDNKEENRMPNDQSLKVVGKHLENGSLGNVLSKEQKVVEGAFGQEEKVSEKRKGRKDKNKHKSSDGRGDKHKDGDRERKSKSKDKKEKKEKMEEKVKEVSTPVQTKLIDNGNNSVNIQSDRGSYLSKGSNSKNGNPGKRKEPEMNGFVHGNGSPINKFPRPLLSPLVKQNGFRNDVTDPGIRFAIKSEVAEAKHKLDAKASCSSLVSDNGTKLDSRQTTNNHAPEGQEAVNNHNHKAIESLSSSESSLGTGRKLEPCQTAMNFASKEQGMVTDYKLNKKVLSHQPIAENGRKLESSQPCTFSSVERKGAVSKPKFDNQEMRINGLGLRKPDGCSMRPPVADQLKETVEAHLKPPHPDTKYLTEILTVPKVEWSDIDDQSWLFAREDNGGKKPKIDSTKLEESKKVWAEALQLESADVTALPYVIPY